MENDTSELFNTEALSFDSTLDSLMDVDYIPDEKPLPFSPSFNAPSEVLMSAHDSFRADLGHIDGVPAENSNACTALEHELRKEGCETIAGENEEITEYSNEKVVNGELSCKGSHNKDSVNESDGTVQISIEIKERVEEESKLREPSPNFDVIKAKRKKNLERKMTKPLTEDLCKKDLDSNNESRISDCPVKIKSDLFEYEKEETLNEPPQKKRKISTKKPNECEKKSEKVQVDQCTDDSGEGRIVDVKACKQTSGSIKTAEVNILEKETVDSQKQVISSDTVSVADRQICLGASSETNVGKAGLVDIAPIDIENHENELVVSNREGQLGEPIKDSEQNNEREEKEFENKSEGVVPDVTESENEMGDFDNESNIVDFEEDNKDIDGDDENNDDENNEDLDEEGKVEDAGDGDDEFDDDLEEEDDDDVDDDEIHNWLEEGLTKEEIKAKRKADLQDGEFIANEKFILEEKGVNPFEVLPAGWIMISHNCGMPVYLHKESRVCTFGRPYNIGAGSSRGHEIPLSAIPCLQYRRQLEKEKLEESQAAEKVTNGVNKDEKTSGETSEKDIMPKPVIKRADDADKIITLPPKELNEYCSRLFNFRTVTVKKFKTWREKRAHLVEERKKKLANMPTLAPETKLITCPIPPEFLTKKSRKKEFVLNPEGKTAVSILHEYTQNVLRVQPTYEFKEMSNADLPFKAIVCLNGMQYGSGVATGKRQAKNEGAKATLEILVPELAELWNEKNPGNKPKNELSSDLKFFEQVAIEDPRVPELCVKSSLPQPYQVLHTCLQRNYGLGDTTFKVEKKMITNQKTEFTLSVGKRTCTVVCKNKREAKQKAAQSMLQQLHPLLKNWASLLRLYSKNTEVGFEEQKDEFPEQVIQQEKKKNFEILTQLKNAMRKVREQRKNFVVDSQVSSSGQTHATLDL